MEANASFCEGEEGKIIFLFLNGHRALLDVLTEWCLCSKHNISAVKMKENKTQGRHGTRGHVMFLSTKSKLLSQENVFFKAKYKLH